MSEKKIDEKLFGNKEILLENTKSLIETDSKLSIAINGKWGIGKTLFVKELITSLGAEKCILIDTWELNELDDLVSMISFQFATQNVEDKTNFVTRLYQFGIDPRFVKKMALTIDEVHLNGKVKKVLDILGEEDEVLANINKLSVLEELYKKGVKYIFIDELDRAYPEKSLKILKEIVYLNTLENIPNMIVSTNLSELSAMIKHTYGEQYDSYAYFDKIFDIIMELGADLNDKLLYMSKFIDRRGFMTYKNKLIDSKGQMNITTILNQLTFRKLQYLASDINYYKMDFDVFHSDNVKLLSKATFILNLLALKYINYNVYSELLDENINQDRFFELLEKNLIQSPNPDNPNTAYSEFRQIIKEILHYQRINLY